MQINVKNVAKILDAEVVLDGVSVIAGYNNMGKSTILKAAYIVLNTFRNLNHKVSIVRKQSIESYFTQLESYFDNSGYVRFPRELLYTIADHVNDYIGVFMNSEKDNYDLFHMIISDSFEEYKEFWPNDMKSDQIYTDQFLMPMYTKVKEICTRDKESDLKYIGEMYIRNIFKGQMSSLHRTSLAKVTIDSEKEHYLMSVRENKISEMEYSVNSEADVFYLPAYNLLDAIDRSVLPRKIYSPEYDIRSALSAEKQEPTLEEYQETEDNVAIIRNILEEVLQGKLERRPSGSIFFRDESLNDWVSIANVASGMKNFLIIQTLVERGKLKRNSILLIDEPETNLHPEWHLKFAEILVLMYKHMGVRSIVNSHSPYFIRALEVKMADHGIKEKGHYYVMEEAERNLFRVQDVTAETDKIYELLYKPLEYLP
ncbi:MAG: ATP-binding protein [Lachnospiraceae bacterium]|nr:ATP-binding protein [Lachnospiraceae bacterium]